MYKVLLAADGPHLAGKMFIQLHAMGSNHTGEFMGITELCVHSLLCERETERETEISDTPGLMCRHFFLGTHQ